MYLTCLLSGPTLYAQEPLIEINNNIIVYPPSQANGFLILDQARMPEVESWEVLIGEARYDAEEMDIVYDIISETTLSDTYYMSVSEDYTNGEHFAKVMAIGAGGTILSETDWVGTCSNCISSYSPCYAECIGGTYAYAIRLRLKGIPPSGSGPSHLKLSGAVPSDPDNVLPYYYEYMSPIRFSTLGSSSSSTGYYHVPEWNPYGKGVGSQIIKVNGVAPGDEDADGNAYVDYQGNGLTGTVYGVKKYLGDWAWANGIRSNVLAGGGEQCAQSFNYFMTQFNAGADFNAGPGPDLECGSSGGSPGGGSSGDAGLDPCGDENWGNYWDCVKDLVPDIGSPLNPIWGDELIEIIVYPFMAIEGTTPIILTKDQFYNEELEFTGHSISMDEGLYLYELHYDDGSVRTTFFENEEAIDYIWTQEEMVTVTIFPVPIIEDSFEMTLEAIESVSFTYTLLTFDGEVLFTEDYILPAGASETFLITPEIGIPAGELVNNFNFNDGSSKSIITIKG